jgi:S-disulfanyl-L-cysteine oxidoreductase SoxD
MSASPAIQLSTKALNSMSAWLRRVVFALGLALLASCGEKAPGTTLDGIFTAEQAQRGEGLYATHCARCHSIQEFTGRMFTTLWSGVPASALYLRIANTMPMDQPGSLGTVQATALMAHILNSNGMPAGDTPLAADLEWMTSITITLPIQ